MSEKLLVVLLYVLVGIGLSLVIPLWQGKQLFAGRERLGSSTADPLAVETFVSLMAAVMLAILYRSVPSAYLICAALFSGTVGFCAGQARWRTAASAFLSLLIVTVLPWWTRQDSAALGISGFEAVKILLITALTFWMLQKKTSEQSNATIERYSLLFIYIGFGLGVAYIVLPVGLTLMLGNLSAWHHWGAYIGPAQLIASGALPLHDIPLQYGLGPSLILAQGCKVDCWTSMYWLSGLTTIALTYMVAGVALMFNRSRHPLSVLATLAIAMASCLFWTAAPYSLSSAIAFPSTFGLRFLPGVLMLAWALHLSNKNDPLDSSAKFGHILWLACFLWSPEAGVHATVVWAPYFVWTRTFDRGFRGFARSIASLITVILTGLSVFSLVYRLVLNEWPLPTVYLNYLIYPPGTMPINPNGTVWFAIACFACWILGILSRRDRDFNFTRDRSSWLMALLCFANFTYYLGRSHDNNILNLMPYLSLLLIATRAITRPLSTANTLASTLLASVVGYSMIFVTTNYTKALQQTDLSAFSPQQLTQSFNLEANRDSFHELPNELSEARPALEYIHNAYGESVAMLDKYLLLNSGEPYPFWSALQVPTNFILLPSELRRSYLSRVAERLNRPGWVLYKDGYEEYLLDYDSVYNRAEEFEMGSYKATRYVPR